RGAAVASAAAAGRRGRGEPHGVAAQGVRAPPPAAGQAAGNRACAGVARLGGQEAEGPGGTGRLPREAGIPGRHAAADLPLLVGPLPAPGPARPWDRVPGVVLPVE